ncbi:hypothetical protein PV416_49825, partial [Streptomyces ipomoeae]|nr:hypothetical protein [Streptomyces ipomoeae]MDX2881423.1 hypothetical protein [Streptomyces ipomoeae]
EALLSCVGPRVITRTGTLFDQTSPAIDKRMASQLMLADWSYNRSALKTNLYVRVAFAACVLAVMLPLFVNTTEESMEFTTEYASIPGVTVYLMVYLSYVAITCGEIAFLCSGMALVARRGGHNWSARGLAFSTVSALLGTAYAASKGS